MRDAMTSQGMSTGLQKVMARARRDPGGKILSLAHRIDVPALERAYQRLRNDAAVGVDGVTKAEYGQDLQRKLTDLHERLKSKKWRHQPIRRVHIPKAEGKTRPIGISCVEDKLVQDAIREVLEAIYEQDFMDCSYGFRPGRSAHDALRALNQAVHLGGVQWIIEADIVSFFDSLDRTQLMEMLRDRIADESLLRLVGKCLHVGVLDGAEYSEPDQGTTQGSVLSPLLGNVYLHTVLDLWFERAIKSRLRGRAYLLRYADGMPEQTLDQRVKVPPPQLPVQGSSSEAASVGDHRGQVPRHRPRKVAAERQAAAKANPHVSLVIRESGCRPSRLLGKAARSREAMGTRTAIHPSGCQGWHVATVQGSKSGRSGRTTAGDASVASTYKADRRNGAGVYPEVGGARSTRTDEDNKTSFMAKLAGGVKTVTEYEKSLPGEGALLSSTLSKRFRSSDCR